RAQRASGAAVGRGCAGVAAAASVARQRARAGEHRRAAGDPSCRRRGACVRRVGGAGDRAARRAVARRAAGSGAVGAAAQRRTGCLRAAADPAGAVDDQRERDRRGAPAQDGPAQPVPPDAPVRRGLGRHLVSARLAVAAACAALVSLGSARGAAAQATDTTPRADTLERVDTLSYDDAAAVAFLYNQPAALRATKPTTIAQDQTVPGNVAILDA